MAKAPDYSTPNKRKRFIDSEIKRIVNLITNYDRSLETYLEDPFGPRRQVAIMNYLDRAEEDFKTFGLYSVVESYAQLELVPFNDYNHLDMDCDIRIGAALWILDQLKANGNLYLAYDFLPNVSGDMNIWYLPTDFFHPCYSRDLIQSVVNLLTCRYDEVNEDGKTGKKGRINGTVILEANATGKKPSEAYRKLIELLPQDAVDRACDAFKDKIWELATRRMKAQGCLDRLIEGFSMQVQSRTVNYSSFKGGPYSSPSTASNQQELADALKAIPREDPFWEAARRSQEMIESSQKLKLHFDDYLEMDRRAIRKETGSREVAAALEGFTVKDPYEICFALFWLLDTGDDAPWLLRSGVSLIHYCQWMLPWRVDQAGWTDDEWEEWYEGRTYNYNGWKDREPVPDQFDFYHEKHEGRNLAQIIYELSRGIVPIGMHPFEQEREQLVREGMDEVKARKVTDTAELLFLMSYQSNHINWFEDEDSEDENESETAEKEMQPGETGDQEAGVNRKEEIEQPNSTSQATENEQLRAELDTLKKQLKSLKSTLAQTRQEANNERAKAEHELKSLRMEHRELADLRELVFNQKTEHPERLEKVNRQYSYPYETKKRTVVFGGHDSFLRAFRPMFTNVRFVDAGNMAFSPDVVKNADVVWIQNNCISHPQYWSIVKNCKQAGVQMRYFGFASAEKCAEQLVTEDQKE